MFIALKCLSDFDACFESGGFIKPFIPESVRDESSHHTRGVFHDIKQIRNDYCLISDVTFKTVTLLKYVMAIWLFI